MEKWIAIAVGVALALGVWWYNQPPDVAAPQTPAPTTAIEAEPISPAPTPVVEPTPTEPAPVVEVAPAQVDEGPATVAALRVRRDAANAAVSAASNRLKALEAEMKSLESVFTQSDDGSPGSQSDEEVFEAIEPLMNRFLEAEMALEQAEDAQLDAENELAEALLNEEQN